MIGFLDNCPTQELLNRIYNRRDCADVGNAREIRLIRKTEECNKTKKFLGLRQNGRDVEDSVASECSCNGWEPRAACRRALPRPRCRPQPFARLIFRRGDFKSCALCSKMITGPSLGMVIANVDK